MSAKVIVACGSGVATSQMVATKIAKLLSQRAVDADVEAVDVKSLPQKVKTADAYVAVVKTEEDFDIPTFNGVAFLTGMGEEEELEKLIACIKDK
ncbi:MAG: PTS sugar transporter subunit IIB [Coriobacteriales bacterium]|nr:PTS sugar transporter subunit IIB [Coriobacteriales bacterium]